MDGSTEHAFPTPETTDSEEVRTELETGATLWLSDPREALRCLRRAAESAADAGDDARSVYLARSAADLRSQASLATSIAPGDGGADPVPSAIPAAVPLIAPQPVLTPGEAPFSDGLSQASAATEAVPATSLGATPAGSEVPAPGIPAAVRAVVSGGFSAATPGTSEASGAPRFAGMNHDPAQTVPATPAASAAMALQEAAAQAVAAAGHYQVSPPGAPVSAPSPESSMQTTWPTGVPMINTAQSNVGPMNTLSGASGPASSGPISAGADTPTATHAPVSVAPTSIGRGFSGSPGLSSASPASAALPVSSAAGPYALSAAMAASNPTPVEVPVVRRQVAEAAARGALAAGASSSVSSYSSASYSSDSAETPVPSGIGRFVEHRALRVAVSPTPNAVGHFEIHPLTQGESLEPGWKLALLVGFEDTERLFPGRG